MFYVLIFSILAVILVVGGLGGFAARRRRSERDEYEYEHLHQNPAHHDTSRRTTKAKRAQSRHDRRKR